MNNPTTDYTPDSAHRRIAHAVSEVAEAMHLLCKRVPDPTRCLDYCRRARSALDIAIRLLEAGQVGDSSRR
jgi:hypothetical protein